MLDALVWLRQSTPCCRHGEIDNNALLALPGKGQVAGLLETTEPKLSSAREEERETGPQHGGATGGDEESDSFLRSTTGEGGLRTQPLKPLRQSSGKGFAYRRHRGTRTPQEAVDPLHGRAWRGRHSMG